MAKTVVNLSDPITTFVTKTNAISDDVGDLATLTTSLDSNLSGAVNELNAGKLNLAGGTMSGVIAMGANKITGVTDPTANQDAATKAYVDTQDATKLNLAGGTMTGNLLHGDNVKAQYGAGNDLQIFHDGSNSIIRDAGTGDLFLQADANITIQNTAGTENKAIFTSDGQVTLYHDNTLRLSTTSAGVSIAGNIILADNGKAAFGAGSDLQIYHDGSNSFIDDAGTGNLNIRANAALNIKKYTGENMINAVADGAVILYHDGVSKFATSASGVTVTGNIDVSGTVDNVDIAARNTVLTNLDSDVGNRASLNTTTKVDLVSAINSVFSVLSTIDSNATNNPVGNLGLLSTSAKSDVVAAINEINGKDPTITLAGDLSGNTTLTNLGNATLTATIAANSVALGTDTTGNYVATISAGEGIDVSGSGSETAGVTISAEDATASNKGIASFNSTDFSVSSGVVTLAKDPTVTLTGAVTGSGTMTNLGNVSIATTATSDPTITLAGDLSGSATLTNLGNATLTATIAANSVALGTDTTGNYIAAVSGGTGISVSGSGSETATATVSITAGSITSTQFQSATSLQIKDAGGTVRKTIFTPNA